MLEMPMTVRGWPHVSFYPADGGEGFGGVYFGTGDSVLKKWWDSKEPAATEALSIPLGELSENDESTLAELFATAGVVNPIETRSYHIPQEQQQAYTEFLTKLKRNPLTAQIQFEEKWDDQHENVEITAPRMAQTGLFEPLIQLAGMPQQFISTHPGDANSTAKFPSLEEQKLADAAYKRLGLELEAVGAEDLQRVRALGYDGGLLVTANRGQPFTWDEVKKGDILVGLHVWPTSSIQQLLAVLNRDDLAELDPLKYYLVRSESEADGGFGRAASEPRDIVVSGRISVPPAVLPRPPAPQPAPTIYAPQPASQPAQGLPVPTIPNAVEPVSRDPSVEAPIAQVVIDPGEIVLDPIDQGPSPERWLSPPRVVAATPLPIPLGSMKSSSGDAPTDEQVDEALPADPKLTMMIQELMQLHYQLNIQDSAMNGGRSIEGDQLKSMIAKKRHAIDQYRRKLREQPRRVPKSQGLPVPSIPNAVAPQDAAHPWPTAVAAPELPRLPASPAQAAQWPSEPVASAPQPRYSEQEIPPTRAATNGKPTLRYDGKTFDEWRTAWQTELSLEKRLEVVKALAAFGANGYGKRAAESIVDLAGQYDWTTTSENRANTTLLDACASALGATPHSGDSAQQLPYQIPSKDSLPVLLDVAKSGSPRQKLFLTWVLPRISDPRAAEAFLKLANDPDTQVRLGVLMRLPEVNSGAPNAKVIELIRQALTDEHTPELDTLIMKLIHYRYDINGQIDREKTTLYYLPELFPNLFNASEQVRRSARLAMRYLQADDVPTVVNQLLKVIDETPDAWKQIEAIRALAAIGPPAKAAVPTLEQLIDTSETAFVPALLASARITGDPPLLSEFLDRPGAKSFRNEPDLGDAYSDESFATYPPVMYDKGKF